MTSDFEGFSIRSRLVELSHMQWRNVGIIDQDVSFVEHSIYIPLIW